MDKIDRQAYLDYAVKFSEEEKRYVNEFGEWLPNTIIDCHAHSNQSKHVEFIEERVYNHIISTFPYFTIAESKVWNEYFYPGKEIISLRFPGVFKGLNHRQANDYLLRNITEYDKAAIFGLPDDIEYTIKKLKHPGVSALKMYPFYLDPPAVEIYEYFKVEILSIAQEIGIPIILHLPSTITGCVNQVLKLVGDFPELKICLAHLGLVEFYEEGIEVTYSRLKSYLNIYFDTALVPSSEVVRAVIENIGIDRIMFGSDAPINLLRSISYINPKLGERSITNFLYHWVDQDEHNEFGYLADAVTHDHWQALKAIKKAIEYFPHDQHERMKSKIFFENAKRFFRF